MAVIRHPHDRWPIHPPSFSSLCFLVSFSSLSLSSWGGFLFSFFFLFFFFSSILESFFFFFVCVFFLLDKGEYGLKSGSNHQDPPDPQTPFLSSSCSRSSLSSSSSSSPLASSLASSAASSFSFWRPGFYPPRPQARGFGVWKRPKWFLPHPTPPLVFLGQSKSPPLFDDSSNCACT